MTNSTTFIPGTVVTADWLNSVDAHVFDYNIKVRDYGARGDGTTDDTAAFISALAEVNAAGGRLELGEGQFVVAAGTIDITADGVSIVGAGRGNTANVYPTQNAPTTLIITGTGAAIRVRKQDTIISNLRITADTTRAAATFDLQSPGIRIEPNDDSAASRADRCLVEDVRIDNQPGDGILIVGSALYHESMRVDIVNCRGFGWRLDAGSYAGLTRTYKQYTGLSQIVASRVSYCGGHAVAAGSPVVITQAEMAIRLTINDLDSYGNGMDTSIMYPTADGIFYEYWIMGENCQIIKSAPCGRSGYSLTNEVLGGICISGRDHQIYNCRFIDTAQPVYWRHVSAQPNQGLTIDTFRLVNATLTHDNFVEVQSATSTGLRLIYDRRTFINNAATRRVGSDLVESHIQYQGAVEHMSGITNTGKRVDLPDDDVFVLPIRGAEPAISVHGVFVLAPSGVTAGGGIFHVRLNASGPVATKWAGETNTVAFAAGGALTGTSGVDGEVTVSCDNTNIYVENRLGYEQRFTYQLLAFSRATAIGV